MVLSLLVFFGRTAKGTAANVEHQKEGPLRMEGTGTHELS